MKAIRSVLYVPGNKPKLIEKTPNYGADAIGLVLEDSVPDDQKRAAREIVREAIGQFGYTSGESRAQPGGGVAWERRRLACPGDPLTPEPRVSRARSGNVPQVFARGTAGEATRTGETPALPGASNASDAPPSSQIQTVLVKINALDSGEAEQDLMAVVRPGLAGIIVPKTQSPEDVRRIDALLTAAETANGVPAGSVEVLLLMETPLAVVRGFELATASPRLATLIFGSAEGGDLTRGLGCTWTLAGIERLYVKSKVLLDARAAGFDNPLDGVYADLNDLKGLVQEAAFAAQLGYRGKLALHPRQVEPINRVFTPSAREVEHQRRVLEAFEKALVAGTAAAVLDGKFIDYAMAATARKVVALADAVGASQ